jgi:drug/metabolite transporter (DMT)-like permease
VNWTNYIVLVTCVLAIASGQLLFKLSAISLSSAGLRSVILSPSLLGALTIYGVATVAWIWQLRSIELSRAYPFMALSFVVVPLLSASVLKEPIDARYWAGTGMIIGGILLTLR